MIGVSAVITMVTLGSGAPGGAERRSPAWAPTCCRCARASAWGRAAAGAPAFKDVDADAIAQQIGGIRPWRRRARTGHGGGGRAQLDDQRHRQHQRLAGDRQLAGALGPGLQPRGTACRLRRVPGGFHAAARAVWWQDPVGQQLRVKAFSCEIIGVLGSRGQGAFGNDQDDVVLLPSRPCSGA